MKITYGIITGNNIDRVNCAIDCLEKEMDPENYEVIVVGDVDLDRKNTSVIKFDEPINREPINGVIHKILHPELKSQELVSISSDRVTKAETKAAYDYFYARTKGWITKKKNLIVENAKHDSIVLSHDYVTVLPKWYTGLCLYDAAYPNWKVMMTKVIGYDDQRFFDWVLDHELLKNNPDLIPTRIPESSENILPYDIKHISKLQYISGGYWIAKKSVMEEFSLNENLVHGEGEDVEWSRRVREKYNFSMNKLSCVKYMNPVKRDFGSGFISEFTEEYIRSIPEGKYEA